MPLVKPCAYCGSEDHENPRHRGHIFPDCMYPPHTPPIVQRRTVPECERCKNSWTDAETQFRNILAIAGPSNEASKHSWIAFQRSMEQPDAKRRIQELWDSITEVQTPSGIKLMVYPYKDPRVNFVLRRVVRGLSAYHKVESCINDNRVWVGYMPSVPQASLDQSLGQFSLGDDFVRYGFSTVNDSQSTGILSVWAIRLFGNRDFVGIVSSFDDAAERYAQVFNED